MEEEEFNEMAELEEETDEAIKVQQNGEGADPIDEDIQHTVGQLLHSQGHQRSRIVRRDSKRELNIEEIVSKALQAERNHWKERLQMSMHEIDRQHKVILTTQGGLQELVKSLKHSVQKNVAFDEEEEEDSAEDLDHEVVSARLIENLKFQVRQLKVRAGVTDVTKTEVEESKQKHKMLLKQLRDKIEQLEDEKEILEMDLSQNVEKAAYLKKENATLHRQCQKLQKIVAKYNESHSGANFHLNADKPREKFQEKMREKKYSMTSYDSTESGTSTLRERTYVEGDQLVSYPSTIEESAIIKDRLRRNIYSARKGDYRSSNVAQCLRCQALFKPPENTHKSCQYHHKGREIKEQFQDNGKLEKVLYKWACCKKPLESPGCCYGYHV